MTAMPAVLAPTADPADDVRNTNQRGPHTSERLVDLLSIRSYDVEGRLVRIVDVAPGAAGAVYAFGVLAGA